MNQSFISSTISLYQHMCVFVCVCTHAALFPPPPRPSPSLGKEIIFCGMWPHIPFTQWKAHSALRESQNFFPISILWGQQRLKVLLFYGFKKRPQFICTIICGPFHFWSKELLTYSRLRSSVEIPTQVGIKYVHNESSINKRLQNHEDSLSMWLTT